MFKSRAGEGGTLLLGAGPTALTFQVPGGERGGEETLRPKLRGPFPQVDARGSPAQAPYYLLSPRGKRGGGPGELSDPAAAAAKSLQSCPTLCDPVDGSPPGSRVPGILQARTLKWVAISFSNV